MSVRWVRVVTDDLTGEELPEGQSETVLFGLDDLSYRIDLSHQNACELRAAIAPFASAASATYADFMDADPYAGRLTEINGFQLSDRGWTPRNRV